MAEDEEAPPAPEGDEGKTFTQADVDRIVEGRLAKEKGKYSDYDDLKAKATKFDESEEANKSELEKATTAATEAAKRAEEAEVRALRLEIAGEKGLTPSQARRLVGTTREELEADADQLLVDFPAAEPPPASKLPRKPKPAGSTEPKGPAALEGKEKAAAALREMRATR